MRSQFAASSLSFILAAAAVGLMSFARGAGGVGALGLSPLQVTRVQSGPFPKLLIDPKGKRQVLTREPERIVSLILGADEILTALVEPQRLAAVSRFADVPLVSTCVDRVPPSAVRIRGLDPERIVSLEPDMVFVARYTLEPAIRMMIATGVPVVRFGDYDSFADVAANVRTAGAAVGAEQQAEGLLRDMQARLAAITERVKARPRPRVLYYSPGGYTEGADTLVNEKIERAGGRNVIAEAGLTGPKQLSVDLLVALDPEVIVMPLWSVDAHRDVAALVEKATWKHVTAARRGQVYGIEARWLTSGSPEGVRGVEEMARLFHPGAFDS